MAAAISDSVSRKMILWFFESDQSDWDESQGKEWTRYFDFENEFIEDAFQKGQNDVAVNGFVIDFALKLQIQREDSQKRSLVGIRTSSHDRFVEDTI